MTPDADPPAPGEDKGGSSPAQNPPPSAAELALATHARALRECLRPDFGNALPEEEMLDSLRQHLAMPDNPAQVEKLLASQARVLDSIFGRLVEAAMAEKDCNIAAAKAALKTQKQYRDTIKALHDLDKVFKKREKEYDKKMMETEYWIPERHRKNNDVKDENDF